MAPQGVEKTAIEEFIVFNNCYLASLTSPFITKFCVNLAIVSTNV